MKRFSVLCFVLLFANLCFAKEYRIDVSESLSVGTSEAYECVAVMAHLAGFEEFNGESYAEVITQYDEYFLPYLINPKVKRALNHFRRIRNTGFSYDAIASAGTYLNPNCHSYRVDYPTLNKYLDNRCGNPRQLLKAVSTFYDETNFDAFYNSRVIYYRQYADVYLEHADEMLKAIEEVKKYYKAPTGKVFISSSILNYNNNFGTSFNDGQNMYFEPKYMANYYSDSLLIHELSHPFSNPVVDELCKNKEVMKYFRSQFKGSKKALMERMAYGTVQTYMYELFNRANETCIMQNYQDIRTVYCNMAYNKSYRFSEIEDVVKILQSYRKGNYASYESFLPDLEKGILDMIESQIPTVPGDENLNEIYLFGNKYQATYCGKRNLSGYNNFVSSTFWRIEDAYKDIGGMYSAGDYLPYRSYPFPVGPGEIYRIEYLMNDGAVLVYYYVSYDIEVTADGATYLIWVE